MRPRLLPVTIAVAAVLLASKIAGFALVFLPDGPGVVASAEAAPAPEPGHVPAPPSANPVSAHSPAPPPVPIEPSAPVQSEISVEERKLLQDLRARRQELDSREHVLAQREGVLDAAEQRLGTRVGELSALQARLEQLDKERHERDEANWAGLVRVYEAMKPREAAAIFNDMDMPVLLNVLDRMKEAKMAAVLAAMQTDRARLATMQLAALRTRGTTVPPAHADSGS